MQTKTKWIAGIVVLAVVVTGVFVGSNTELLEGGFKRITKTCTKLAASCEGGNAKACISYGARCAGSVPGHIPVPGGFPPPPPPPTPGTEIEFLRSRTLQYIGNEPQTVLVFDVRALSQDITFDAFRFYCRGSGRNRSIFHDNEAKLFDFSARVPDSGYREAIARSSGEDCRDGIHMSFPPITVLAGNSHGFGIGFDTYVHDGRDWADGEILGFGVDEAAGNYVSSGGRWSCSSPSESSGDVCTGLSVQTEPMTWVNAARCGVLRGWADAGLLTANLGSDLSEVNACSLYHRDIWYGYASETRCRQLVRWLGEGTLTSRGANAEADQCVDDYPWIWFGWPDSPGV